MRRIRIYQDYNLASGQIIELDQAASRHLLQVLRKKIGDEFCIFNGKNGEFHAVIVSENKKAARVEIGERKKGETESPLSIHLGQAMSRGERMDYAIQKATECGVTEITPLVTEFCQVQLSGDRADKRIAHWQAIAIAAAEQSGRVAVPMVHPPILFDRWIQQEGELKIICCPRIGEKNALNTAPVSQPNNIFLTIGPEGGFSDAEIKKAIDAKFLCMSLGPRILRTETATVVALAILQEKWGDIKI